MLIPCPECGSKVSDKAPYCVKCGLPFKEKIPNSTNIAIKRTNENKSDTSSIDKNKFNWMALIFSSMYYGGYGNIKKGMLLAVLSFMPLTQIIVGIYSGIKANQDLPVKSTKFEWQNAILVGALQFACTAITYYIIQVIKS